MSKHRFAASLMELVNVFFLFLQYSVATYMYMIYLEGTSFQTPH